MTTLLQEPVVKRQTEQRDRFSRQVDVRAAPPRESPSHLLRDRIKAAGEFTLGLVLTAIYLAVTCLLYVVAVLAIPLLPFLLPLLLAPVVLLYAILIQAVGIALGLG